MVPPRAPDLRELMRNPLFSLVMMALPALIFACTARKLTPQEMQCSEGKILRNGECQPGDAVDDDPIDNPTGGGQVPGQGGTQQPATGEWNCGLSEHEGRQLWMCNGHTDIAYKCDEAGKPIKKDCGKEGNICKSKAEGADDECVSPKDPTDPSSNDGGSNDGGGNDGGSTDSGGNGGVVGGAWSCSSSRHGQNQLWTCGGSGSKMYKCDAAGTVLSYDCADEGLTCEKRPLGTDDRCAWKCQRSAISSGEQFWTCNVNKTKAYRCDAAGMVQVQDCAASGQSCQANARGTDDQCAAPGSGIAWDCNKSKWGSGQLWTCNADKTEAYRCDASGAAQSLGCIRQGKACRANASGTDDVCQ